MWEKAVFLIFFADLCLAQRGALLDLHGKRRVFLRTRNRPDVTPARRPDTPLAAIGGLDRAASSLTSIEQVENFNLAPSHTSHTSEKDPNETHKILELRDPQDANVYTTVLFPSVPTEAPTGVIVPIFVTYTGIFDAAAAVPSGYNYDPPSNLGQTAAESPTPQQPTAQTEQPTQKPTALPTQQTDKTTNQPTAPPSQRPSDKPDKPQPTQSGRPNTLSDRPSQSHLQSHAPSSTPNHSSSHPVSSQRPASSAPISSSRTSSSSTATGTGLDPNNNGAIQGPNQDPHLSKGAVAGIAGGVVGFTAALAGLFLLMLSRRKKEKVPDSPGIYPQEAYLYDPPITPPGEGPGGALMATHNIGRSATPEMVATENDGLLPEAAAGAVAAGAAAQNRRGTMSGQNSPRPGFNGYAPVDTREVTELGGGNPFESRANEYRNSDTSSNRASWPLNPTAPNNLGIANASSTSLAAGVESRSQTPGSMYRNNESSGPAIAGVGSQRYERRISTHGSGNLLPSGGESDAMREARRAWVAED
jgi:outer membrane biosynthesis protein TonB